MYVCMYDLDAIDSAELDFNNISATSWRWRKSEYMEKTTDLPQVSDKFYHIMLYWMHFVMVIGIDYIGSFKYNYHTIMTVTDPTTYWISKHINASKHIGEPED